jgi:hypothetical protein
MGNPMKPLISLPCLLLFLPLLWESAFSAQTSKTWLGGQSIGDSFGVQIKEWRTTPEELDKIKAAGFGLLRYGIVWRDVEAKPGSYDWTRPDKFIAQVRAQHLRSIIIIYGGNSAYSGEMDAPQDGGNLNHVEKLTIAPRDEKAVQAYARFAAAAAQRYKGDDIIWEIWNEPDLNYFWSPKADPDAYSTLASTACSAMRDVAPAAKIVGPAAAGMPSLKDRLGVGLIATVLRSPASLCFDAISVHSYRIEPNKPPKEPESVMRDNEASLAFIAEHAREDRPPLPLICSEWGFSSFQVTPDRQADYVLRTHLSNLLSGVPVTIWYEWRDSMQGGADSEAHYGLTDYDGKDKPAIQAVRKILPLIRDDVIEHRISVADPRNYVLLLRHPDNKHALLFWSTRDSSETSAFIKVGREAAIRMTSTPRLIQTGENVPQVAVGNTEEP